MADFETIRYAVADRIATLTFNRPEARNAITSRMRRELGEALLDIRDNPDVWLAVITGAGSAFCSGQDLYEKIGIGDIDADAIGTDDLYLRLRGIDKPVIAAINGPCLAQGAGFALLSDIRIMADTGFFGWPQVKRGIASMSGPIFLSRHVPMGVALRYLLTGDMIHADDALRHDLVHAVVPPERLAATVAEWAAKILDNAPLAVRAIKNSTVTGAGLDLEAHFAYGRTLVDGLYGSADAHEGITAFKEKRKPVWKAR